ncbi:MAG: hydroxymethylglutaryl-CoA lyase [Planctomycetota bacterium]|jgi:hydroxymethylglutaryl-CoA lyase
MIKVIECPRDAMQGIKEFIPTELKIKYANQLLKVGFDTIDIGSFVSPSAIPQMRDTIEVIKQVDLSETKSKLLVITANSRGAKEAVKHKEIDYLGYPFSISETFQQRNTNSSIAESFDKVKALQASCLKHDKELVVYLSMGFGNPYGDPYSPELIEEWTDKLSALGIKIFSLSDTVGVATPELLTYLFKTLTKDYPELEFGAHLHTHPHNWREKIKAAYKNGCRRFDTAIFGYGGCPMAKDDLLGNMPTEHFINAFGEENLGHLDLGAFEESMRIARTVFER